MFIHNNIEIIDLIDFVQIYSMTITLNNNLSYETR